MSIKQDRMQGRILTLLSELLRREVSDPALKNITITEVEIDQEFMYARIYVNALGDESRRDDVLAGLRRAQGYLRRELGKRLQLRNAPELHFEWDTTLERGERINQLLSSIDIPPAPPEPEPEEDDDFDDDDDE
jgi:ribosome-binding factor A